ncbi:MAG: ribosome-associated translation inhibitor RaiA [Bacilli bacterium]|nr:ribosome-associated translation inhibitor RaiA [Bacilli bacterium]
MKFNIHGSRVKVTPSIKNYIQEKIGKLDKYLEDPDAITANVVVRVRGLDQIVEVTIPMKKAILRNEEANSDLYAAIDLVADKLERQIRKNKTRIKKKVKTVEYGFIDFEVAKEETDSNKIVKRKEIDNKPMSEEEAILQMNLLGHEFFVFENIDNHTTSVIYRRKDGNYGIIDTK